MLLSFWVIPREGRDFMWLGARALHAEGGYLQWGWLCVGCPKNQAEPRQYSPGTPVCLCIPGAALCMSPLPPACLPWVHGNKPVLCPLVIKRATTFCLIHCVAIRWSPDRQFGFAWGRSWFAAYKLVWGGANASLAYEDSSGRICFFCALLKCGRWGGRAQMGAVLFATCQDVSVLLWWKMVPSSKSVCKSQAPQEGLDRGLPSHPGFLRT